MSSQVHGELTSTERIAELAWQLAKGEGLTVEAVATRYGISRPRAAELLAEVSRVIPIVDEYGTWRARRSKGKEGSDG